MENPFKGLEFRRVYSERDVVPEADGDGKDANQLKEGEFLGNGSGLTRTIQAFINRSDLQRSLVEDVMLDDLNKIFFPDVSFSRILIQRHNHDRKWEIFLEEKTKGRISLSQSGSGLKTIFIVLAHILLLPTNSKPLNKFIFAFEELENNLHPAILRRLLDYLFRIAVSKESMMVLTTHSSVAIDFFSKSTDAQIIHVTHDSDTASCRTVTTYVHNKTILDDLDVRASDLLQSNGVIWVEGPSDRIYLNRWIELFDDELKEELHYQIVYYGGKILYHFSADAPGNSEKCEIFKNNRNAYIVIDSDLKSEGGTINETKRRISNEVTNNEGTAWVTMGKEIENYLPAACVAGAFDKESVRQIDKFEKFADYVEHLQNGDDDSSIDKKKVGFAEKVAPYLTKETAFEVMDLRDQIQGLCINIRRWNKMPERQTLDLHNATRR